jgi:hypothetical protein
MMRWLVASATALGVMTGAMALAGTQASAQTTPKIWDGIVIPTAGCTFSEPWRATYRPKLKAGDPNSSIVFWPDGQMSTMVKVGGGQFSGNGTFNSIYVSDHDNTINLSGNTNNFTSFTQTPSPVTANTTFIEITGTVNGGVMCATAIHGVFSLRAPQATQ